MAKAMQQVKGRPVKKSWHQIVSTAAFDSTPLGQTYLADPSLMLDRQLTANLAELTGDIKQQGTSLRFRVSEIKDGKGIAGVIGYEVSNSHLRRLVRRGVERFDDSLECLTSDGMKVKLKPFAVTKSAASKQRINAMRKLLRDAITKEVGKLTFDELLRQLLSNKLQLSLKDAGRKVFPLKMLEIRKVQLISATEGSKQADERPEKPKKTEEKEGAENPK